MIDFEQLYITWYSRVKYFAYDYLLSETEAENVTQDVFLELYQRREILNCNVNIVAYLFTSVKNRCIDHIRHKILEQEAAVKLQEAYHLKLRMKFDSLEAFNMDFMSESTVKDIIDKALQSLPERCREIFVKSKIEGKKQSEIAEELHISVKTIECQMTIAYKKLREELKNYAPLLAFLFYN